MQIYRNDQFIQRRAKLGRYANLGGMGILLIGLIINVSMRTEGLLLSMLALIVGFALKGEPRMSILEDFYHRGIPSPSGRLKWGTPSAKAIEDNVEVYLGHTVFNRHNDRIKQGGRFAGYLHGQKWRSREEWVIGDNTHEALISEEVANRIREMKAKKIREPRFNAKRTYGLSGVIRCGVAEPITLATEAYTAATLSQSLGTNAKTATSPSAE